MEIDIALGAFGGAQSLSRAHAPDRIGHGHDLFHGGPHRGQGGGFGFDDQADLDQMFNNGGRHIAFLEPAEHFGIQYHPGGHRLDGGAASRF